MINKSIASNNNPNLNRFENELATKISIMNFKIEVAKKENNLKLKDFVLNNNIEKEKTRIQKMETKLEVYKDIKQSFKNIFNR